MPCGCRRPTTPTPAPEPARLCCGTEGCQCSTGRGCCSKKVSNRALGKAVLIVLLTGTRVGTRAWLRCTYSNSYVRTVLQAIVITNMLAADCPAGFSRDSLLAVFSPCTDEVAKLCL